jgi:DNA-binding CsgD family transcriptional regulator
MDIDGVLQALTEPELRTAWNACLTKLVAECDILGLCVRWVFSGTPRLTKSLVMGAHGQAIESFLHKHPGLPQGNGAGAYLEWETPIAVQELQAVPAEVFVTDARPGRAVAVAKEICGKAGFKGAVLHSYCVLLASFAARKMAVAENGDATVLVDDGGHVHARNDAAALLLARTVGLLEESEDHRLRFLSRKDDARFREGLKDALEDGVARRRLLFDDELMLVLKACRMPLGLSRERLVIVTARKLTEAIEVDEGELSSMLRVSPLQVRLAQALLRGDTIIAHAESIGCSESTVRWHLARLMDSLGCRKQSDVVLKLSRMLG